MFDTLLEMEFQRALSPGLMQELGRAGQDGLTSMATILYTREDIGNAKAWIKEQ